MSNLAPPARLRADPLDSEMYDIVRATERGFVQFPPPPPPVDGNAPPTGSAEPEVDFGRTLTRALICIALAIPVFSAWYVWTH